MGRIFRLFLDDHTRVLVCSFCKTHLSHYDALISKAFHGHFGVAWLFETVINVEYGEPTDRQLTTGLHTVRDIYCRGCSREIGWKYDKAYESSQKYKENRFILERSLLEDVMNVQHSTSNLFTIQIDYEIP